MPPKKKMGRPKLPDAERGKRAMFYLSADAYFALVVLAGDKGNKSEIVSGLIVAELQRRLASR